MDKKETKVIQEKKKEAISKLPNYRGEVPSKNTIRSLPGVKQGEIFWVSMDEKAYIVAEKDKKKVVLKALDETASISTGMTIYDLNHSIVAKEELFDWNSEDVIKELDGKLQEWFYETTKDTFYLFYGRMIHYVTLVKKSGKDANLLENLKEMIEQFGNLISIDVNDEGEKPSLEIWVRTDKNAAELLYFFPYDEGLVEI